VIDPSKRRRVLMLMDWYSVSIHEGIAEYAARRGWMLNSHTAQWRSLPEGWRGDGVIASLNVGSENLMFLQRLGLPTVDLGIHYPGIFPGVAADNREVGKKAARLFLERGHKRFAFFFFQNSLVEVERFGGFCEVLREAGFDADDIRWTGEPGEVGIDYGKALAWATRQLAELPKPCAVTCGGDYLASMIVDAAIDADVRIPEEIMLLGAGNDRLICNFAPVTISSVDTRQKEIGHRAAELLDRLMEGEPPPDAPVRVPAGETFQRASTDFRAVFDPVVRKALAFIWKNYPNKIGVEEVAAHAGVSRSALYKLFEAETGESIGRGIIRLRIEKAAELLRDTALPVGAVGARCGFSGPVVFHNAFLRETGLGPREWRKQAAADGG
jgi:LacI family transcriptional regulator